MAAISRGYSAVENGSGAIVSSVRSLSAGDEVGIIMSDGRAYATVSRTEPNDRRVGNTDGK